MRKVNEISDHAKDTYNVWFSEMGKQNVSDVPARELETDILSDLEVCPICGDDFIGHCDCDLDIGPRRHDELSDDVFDGCCEYRTLKGE